MTKRKQNSAVRFFGLRRKADALTIEFGDGSEWLTVGVVVADNKRALLSVDSTHAPSVQLERETVATAPGEGQPQDSSKPVAHPAPDSSN